MICLKVLVFFFFNTSKSTVLCLMNLIHRLLVLPLEIFFWPQMIDCTEAVEMDKDVAAFSWNHNHNMLLWTQRIIGSYLVGPIYYFHAFYSFPEN